MANDSAELAFDPFPRSELELVPDSGSLRVSNHIALESGIPPARARQESLLFLGEEQLERSLTRASRAEATLGQLGRALKHLSLCAATARDANRELSQELDGLRLHLLQVNENEATLRVRVKHLELLLEVMRGESARERNFLVEQQDLFLLELLSDHERQLSDLCRALSPAPSPQPPDELVTELVAQRDQAREYARRCELQRDLAWQELACHAPPPTPTPAVSSAPIATIVLRAAERPLKGD